MIKTPVMKELKFVFVNEGESYGKFRPRQTQNRFIMAYS